MSKALAWIAVAFCVTCVASMITLFAQNQDQEKRIKTLEAKPDETMRKLDDILKLLERGKPVNIEQNHIGGAVYVNSPNRRLASK